MVQSPSWEVNWFAASQEIPRISRNPKIHYRTHKRPPPVSIQDQPNPVHIPTSHLLKIHPNIIHPSTPSSPQWSPSLRFPQQDPLHPLSSPIRATCPAYLISLCFIAHYKAKHVLSRVIFHCFLWCWKCDIIILVWFGTYMKDAVCFKITTWPGDLKECNLNPTNRNEVSCCSVDYTGGL